MNVVLPMLKLVCIICWTQRLEGDDEESEFESTDEDEEDESSVD